MYFYNLNLTGRILSSINDHKDKYNLLSFIREQNPPRGGWMSMYYEEMNTLFKIFEGNNIDFILNIDILYDIQIILRGSKKL